MPCSELINNINNTKPMNLCQYGKTSNQPCPDNEQVTQKDINMLTILNSFHFYTCTNIYIFLPVDTHIMCKQSFVCIYILEV